MAPAESAALRALAVSIQAQVNLFMETLDDLTLEPETPEVNPDELNKEDCPQCGSDDTEDCSVMGQEPQFMCSSCQSIFTL